MGWLHSFRALLAITETTSIRVKQNRDYDKAAGCHGNWGEDAAFKKGDLEAHETQNTLLCVTLSSEHWFNYSSLGNQDSLSLLLDSPAGQRDVSTSLEAPVPTLPSLPQSWIPGVYSGWNSSDEVPTPGPCGQRNRDTKQKHACCQPTPCEMELGRMLSMYPMQQAS